MVVGFGRDDLRAWERVVLADGVWVALAVEEGWVDGVEVGWVAEVEDEDAGFAWVLDMGVRHYWSIDSGHIELGRVGVEAEKSVREGDGRWGGSEDVDLPAPRWDADQLQTLTHSVRSETTTFGLHS